MQIVLYTTECPQCNVLTKKLEAKGIQFQKNMDIDEMTRLNIDAVPVLSVDGKLLAFVDAVRWVNGQP